MSGEVGVKPPSREYVPCFSVVVSSFPYIVSARSGDDFRGSLARRTRFTNLPLG